MQDALCLEELLNEAHVAGDLKVLVTLNCEAEHDRGSLLEVLPELAILALGEQVAKDVLVGCCGILGRRGGLTEAVSDGEGHVDASLELFDLSTGWGLFLLHDVWWSWECLSLLTKIIKINYLQPHIAGDFI